MISRGLFAIKFVVPALVLWQLGSLNCVEAKVHAAGASGMNTAAGANADVVTNTELTQLEQKLFERDYTTDLPPQRLERLEKMVFGKVGTGTETERIAALKAATITSPLEGNSTTAAGKDSSATASAVNSNKVPASRSSNNRHKHTPNTEATNKTANNESINNERSGDQTQYPAVAAIEKKLFGKDYSSDSITSRLDRLELKQFGKVSNSDDLSERVDHLKQATGIDIAKRAGSDWVDDDDLSFTDAPGVGKITPFTPDSTGAIEDGGNINNFIDNYGNGNGYFGARQGGAMGAMPHTTPLTAPLPPPHMGLNQEVTALEKEIFGKTYTREALPERVNRLEAAIFPDEKPAADKSLPDRVSRLLVVVPLSGGDATTADSQYGEDGSTGKHGLKLSKMLGNMMGFTGAYPGSGSSNLSADPQTGLLYNNSTGQLIDPSTGAVIGQRMVNNMGTMSPWGFGSGMSPYGTMPYGGFGMGGVGLGVGRMGMMGGYGGGGLW